MSNELVPHSGQDAFRISTDAAQLCKQIVVATAKPIKGKKFVGVEGWQAIALAHGCVASSGAVERVETGFRAIGKVIRMSDGQTLSTAEGFVGDDETLWAVRPEYARRAMAQCVRRLVWRRCPCAVWCPRITHGRANSVRPPTIHMRAHTCWAHGVCAKAVPG